MQPCHRLEMPGNQERVKAQGYCEAQGWTLSLLLAREPRHRIWKVSTKKKQEILSHENPQYPALQQPLKMEAIATLWSLWAYLSGVQGLSKLQGQSSHFPCFFTQNKVKAIWSHFSNTMGPLKNTELQITSWLSMSFCSLASDKRMAEFACPSIPKTSHCPFEKNMKRLYDSTTLNLFPSQAATLPCNTSADWCGCPGIGISITTSMNASTTADNKTSENRLGTSQLEHISCGKEKGRVWRQKCAASAKACNSCVSHHTHVSLSAFQVSRKATVFSSPIV